MISPAAVGYTVCAFVQVDVAGSGNERRFVASVLKVPQVEECHRLTGDYPYLLKIWARDLDELNMIVEQEIQTLKGVVGTRTFVVLSSPKDHVTGLAIRVTE